MNPEYSRFLQTCLIGIAVPNGARALDAPCGNGRHFPLLIERGYEITGVDINPRVLEVAKNSSKDEVGRPPVRLLEADLTKPLDPSVLFDLIVIVHFYKPGAIGAISASAASGAFIVIETFGNHGGNAQELPDAGAIARELGESWRVLVESERRVAATPGKAVAKVFAQRT